MKAMNAKSDPSEEERKGGAGKIGKLLLSCTDDVLAMVAYVPLNNCEKAPAKEWLEHVVNLVVPKKDLATFAPCEGVAEANYYTCLVKANPDVNAFPIKMRDPAITEAYAYLKKRDLFPDDDDDDEDDYVFGDEDFP